MRLKIYPSAACSRARPPTFAFIDPFGWKGVPFAIVREVMSHQSCEVVITFMYEEINRFLSQDQQGAELRRVLRDT